MLRPAPIDPQHLAVAPWLAASSGSLDGARTRPYKSRVVSPPLEPRATLLAFLKAIFTWWNSATIGIRFTVARRGVFIGQDDYGSRYYEARDASDSYDGRKRRWVIYRGYAEASKVPAEWHGWLHYTFEEPPTTAPLTRKAWEKDHHPNLTGTLFAWRPKGSIARGGERQAATGDYEAWRPE
jgi:NADH:ubiquinone oxidoreductase subunit